MLLQTASKVRRAVWVGSELTARRRRETEASHPSHPQPIPSSGVSGKCQGAAAAHRAADEAVPPGAGGSWRQRRRSPCLAQRQRRGARRVRLGLERRREGRNREDRQGSGRRRTLGEEACEGYTEYEHDKAVIEKCGTELWVCLGLRQNELGGTEMGRKRGVGDSTATWHVGSDEPFTSVERCHLKPRGKRRDQQRRSDNRGVLSLVMLYRVFMAAVWRTMAAISWQEYLVVQVGCKASRLRYLPVDVHHRLAKGKLADRAANQGRIAFCRHPTAASLVQVYKSIGWGCRRAHASRRQRIRCYATGC